MKAKEEFKPHYMYDKDGKAYKANTHKQHLDMKAKGYGHKEDPKKKKAKKKKAPSPSKSFLKKVDKGMGGRY